MKHLKIMGLCLVAALALSVVAATAASARPYGFYVDGTEEAAIGYKYKGKKLGTKVVKLVTPSHGSIECTGATGSGEVKSLNDAEGEIVFTGCSFEGIKCNSSEPKGKEGEIITREITVLAVLEHVINEHGELVEEPALLFKPLKETKLECTSLEKLTITNTSGAFGGLLVLVPSNTFLGTLLDLAFEQTNGVQKGTGEFLLEEGGTTQKAGLTTTGEGLKKFKEGSAEEAELTIEFEKEVSIFA